MIKKDDKNIKNIKVLLIEDNSDDIQAITSFLDQSERLNADIKTVDSIKKANTVMFYDKMDIIIVDINIQGMKFEELIESIDKNNLSNPTDVSTT